MVFVAFCGVTPVALLLRFGPILFDTIQLLTEFRQEGQVSSPNERQDRAREWQSGKGSTAEYLLAILGLQDLETD